MANALGAIAGLVYVATATGIWWLCVGYLLPEQWYEKVRESDRRLPTWRIVGWLYALFGLLITILANIFTWHSYLSFNGRMAEFNGLPAAGWVATGIFIWVVGFLLPVVGKEFSAWLQDQDQRRSNQYAGTTQPPRA